MRQLADIRERTIGRLGEVRASLLKERPELEELVLNVSSQDKEYDRAIQDLLTTYRLYGVGKIKKITFEKQVNSQIKRVERLAGDLSDSVEELRQELEK
jgi:hypothetical protein